MRKIRYLLTLCAMLSTMYSTLSAQDAVGTTFESGGITYQVTSVDNKECKLTKITPSAIIQNSEGIKEITIPATVAKSDNEYNVTAIGLLVWSETYSPTFDKLIIESSTLPLKSEGATALAYTGSYSRTYYLTYKSLTIGRPIDGILFSKNSALREVTITYDKNVLPYMTFVSYVPESSTLYVPKTLLDNYKESEWKSFSTIAKLIEPYEPGWTFIVDGITYRVLTAGEDNTCEVTESPNVKTDAYTILPAVAVADVDHEYKLVRIGEKAFQSKKIYFKPNSIPDGVTEIGNYAFNGATGTYLDLDLPESVVKMGDYAFQNCFARYIKLPGVRELGKSAFDGCDYLESIVLPEGLSAISDYCFYDAKGLKSLTIPTTVPKFGYKALDSYDYSDKTKQVMNIEELIWNDTDEPFEIKDNELYDNIYVKKIVLGRPMTYGDKSNYTYNLFASKNSIVNNLPEPLEELVIGDKVEQILTLENPNATGKFDTTIFPSLKKLTIGKSLKEVPDFSTNTNLMEITCNSATPIPVNGEFSDETYANAVLILPEGAKEAYAAAPVWRKFACLSDIKVNIDASKINVFAGEGDNLLPVMIRWNDDKKINNVVWGVRYADTKPTALEAAVLIAGVDSRFSVAKTTLRGLSLDVNCDGLLTNTEDQMSVTGSADEWKTKEIGSALVISSGDLTVSPEYLFYIPAETETAGVWLPEEINRPLADGDHYIPYMINCEGFKTESYVNIWYNQDENGKNSTAVIKALPAESIGFESALTTYQGAEGDVYVKVNIIDPDGDADITSNICKLTITAPTLPVESITTQEEMEVHPNGDYTIDYSILPDDASYTAVRFDSSNPEIVEVDEFGKLKVLAYGECDITVSYKFATAGTEAVKAVCKIHSTPNVAIESVNFGEGTENGIITVNARQMFRLIPRIYPENSDIRDVTITLTENPAENGIGVVAQPYSVNYFDENKQPIHTEDMMTFRAGTAKLRVRAIDGYEREFTVNVVNPVSSVSDYRDGTMIINEDWFGHTNSGMNYITPDYEIVYNPYFSVNNGKTFGCTAQYATVYGDKLIVVSKQDKDGGEPGEAGGRVVIADTASLERIGSINELKVAGETKSADGRAVAGAGGSKAYVSSNNGVYILDIDNISIVGKVSGAHLEGTADALYDSQTGDMVHAGKYVFAVHQNNGLIAIDTETDAEVKVFGTLTSGSKRQVQGVTQTSDGNIWYCEVTPNGNRFVCIDPETLEEIRSEQLPSDIKGITCGWGAWRSTQFFGDMTTGSLWFVPDSNSIAGGAVGENAHYYRWDTSKDISTLASVFNLGGLKALSPQEKQMVYGTSRYDDRTGELIVMTTETGTSGHYANNWYYFVDPETGNINHTIIPEVNFWFQSLPVFPDKFECELTDEYKNGLDLKVNDEPAIIDLKDIVTDPDNHDYNIRIHELQTYALNANEVNIADFERNGTKLIVTPKNVGTTNYVFSVESNGKTSDITLPVAVSGSTGVSDLEAQDRSIKVTGNRVVMKGYKDEHFYFTTLDGRIMSSFDVDADEYVAELGFSSGVYVLAGKNVSVKIIIK